ncbi:MAG TPA: dihydropyrimidine dehydrogenase [Lachnoclostridium phytofermentans]|uniref:Dihydropyrimidine dehydrogenase n=1 Tax=Lachnoclostridium phytofermentans TaxID=66219 RepID=A0A3D2X369_9FIRM|nr:NAD(P)-dependent oxidoreductase [Lachnoclostridium sp.]HCL00818.1 dihydropyrimidine dehydrogenase [Lachnoclostridium phytofermentans]
MADHVVYEAKRCLNCKKPLCMTGCPISTQIPTMIQEFLNGGIAKAGEMVFENNPLSIVCSLVCDHDKQCEGHCILGKKGMPVHISSIENYISSTYFDQMKLDREEKKNKRAAVIGSGPAGITISILLAKKGYDVTIFETREKIGGVLRYGIPEFRLPKKILDNYKKKMLELGIRFRPNTTIGGAIGIDDLFRDGYLAIFVGTGVWRPNALHLKGETLGNVHYAIDYLVNPDSFELGDSLAIIGAGNSAMDVARTAIRKGVKEVTVYSHREEIKASVHEVEYAKIDGVNFETCKSTVELTEDGPIMNTVTWDEEGNMEIVEGSAKLYPAQSMIIAISQGPKDKIVSTTKGIGVNQRGLIVTNEQGETSRPGIFASGDVVNGAKTVVEAVHYSKKVAEAMDEYMSKL